MGPAWPQFTQDGASWPVVGSAHPAAGAAAVSHFPLDGWPAAGTVDYLTKLIVLALLLLALPYLVGKLLTSPGEVFATTTGKAMSAAVR
jgi:hypothetical protein